MNNNTLSILIAFFLITTTSLIKAQTIDSVRSKVTFEVGNMKVRTVEGSFTGMKGVVKWDSQNVEKSSFDVSIDAKTVNTNNKKQDGHIRESDFLDVENYPTISFKSSVVEPSASGYITKGILKLHGLSKEVMFPFTVDGKTLQGKLKINRSDYKLAEDTNSFMMSEEIEITIICVLQD